MLIAEPMVFGQHHSSIHCVLGRKTSMRLVGLQSVLYVLLLQFAKWDGRGKINEWKH